MPRASGGSLVTTLGKQAELRAVSTFSLTRQTGGDSTAPAALPDERESHPEAEGKDKPLILCSVKTKRPVSLLLLDLPLEGQGRTRFLRQTTDALVPFVFTDAPALPRARRSKKTAFAANADAYCQPINYTPTLLRVADWEKPKLEFNLAELKEYVLPVLKSDGAGNDKQFLKITRAKSEPFKTDDQGNYLPVVATDLGIEANLGSLAVATMIHLEFDLEQFAFRVRDDVGINFGLDKIKSAAFLGFQWEFVPNQNKELFTLVTQGGNYQLKQAPGAEVRASFTGLTSDKEPIVFAVQDFVWTPKGVSFVGHVSDFTVRLFGLNTKFRFTGGSVTVHENRIADFTLSGSGPLPPELTGNALVNIALHFGQREGRITLLNCAAELAGAKVLHCDGARFHVDVDGLELKFVYDGRYHFYVAVTGKAKYIPLPRDAASGPLSWLPGIELQLVKAPLTGDWTTLRKHIKFQVELPHKKLFDFLGCFKMELRSFSFVPEDTAFSPAVPAIVLGGQVFFTENGGDKLVVKIDFHNLHIGMPKRGSIVPQLYFKHLGLSIKAAAFEMEGEVEYIDEEIEPGLLAKGFAGSGALHISGWPEIAATFTFLRVSPDDGQTWKRAWFIYIEARKMSIPIPVWAGVYIYLREVGLGFGYRYTLASIRRADELDDPAQLIKELQRLSRTQGNLSHRDQWRVDVESSRWTLAFRALLAQSTANRQGDYFSWSPAQEKDWPCLFVMDAVIGLRSDLTFLMAARAWLFTNYFEFNTDEDLRNRPLVSGFALFQPRKRRLLVHAASNDSAKFGPSARLPDFLQEAMRASRFSFTLLAEPRLLHIEAGWPNQLGRRGKLGPLNFEFKGGAIFRLSDEHIVIGVSLLARASFELSAGINLGFVGASISASANVALGMRMIGAVTFKDALGQSGYYSAVGIEMRLTFAVEFWLRIKVWFVKITKRFRFSFDLGLTYFLEIGVTGRNLLGVRGTATVSLRIMGHSLHFGIHLSLNGNAVENARRLTEKYLHIGLEATEVEPIPGDPTTRQSLAARIEPLERAPLRLSQARALAESVLTPDDVTTLAAPVAAPEIVFEAPDYALYSIPVQEANGQEVVYFLLLPSGEQPAGQEKQAFLPVPPTASPKADFRWTLGNVGPAQIQPFDWQTGAWGAAIQDAHQWCVRWEEPIADSLAGVRQSNNETPDVTDAPSFHPTIKAFLSHAFVTQGSDANDAASIFAQAVPVDNPRWLPHEQRVIEDQRVYHPTDDAVEAAVRGAAQQFEGSPYLKRDILSPYEESLKNAFAAQTTVYTPSGQLPQAASAQEEALAQQQQAIQLRGVIINQLISELQQYAAAATAPDRDETALQQLRCDSLAFQMGLVFRANGRPAWLAGTGGAGALQQRTRGASLVPDSAVKAVVPFNRSHTRFDERPPSFQRVRHYTDANTIAITWDLTWPREWQADLTGAQKEPEEHLLYYLVRRRALAGDEREVEYSIKNVEVLNRTADNVLERLRPRFQLVDHFNEETREDQSALPPSGRSYLYTITPVDVAGLRSSRPLALVATRRPSEPPPVINDAELIVRYQLNPNGIETPGDLPQVLTPDAHELWVEWPEPSDPQRHSRVAVDGYRLVFRREPTFPAGSYGADGATQQRTASVLPTTNARPLRTDIFFDWQSAEAKTVGAAAEALRMRVTLKLADLRAKGIYPADGRWRAEAWRVFLQTRSRGQVYSALTPVQIVLQFRTTHDDIAERREEKRPSLLEWIAQPIRFRVLPPEDESAQVGALQVPMPQLAGFALNDNPLAQLVAYQPHPDQLRAVRFAWNQGPSDQPLYPADLHAGYRLYEFDLDAHTAEALDAGCVLLRPPAFAATGRIVAARKTCC
ncbi:MAG: hypothetical protein U0Y68_24875 [Blastocatellia bacterium]